MRAGPPDVPGVSSTDITLRSPAGNGDDGSHVAPPLLLTKRPSDVPTTTAPPTAEIPKPLIRCGNWLPGFNSTCIQVAPPSTLRPTPARLIALQSALAVTSTTPSIAGTYAMDCVKIAGSDPTRRQCAPPSVLLNRPPLSEAASISLRLNGFTATAFVRPPCFRLGCLSSMDQLGKKVV